MLCLAATNADVVASGTWLNVRAFPPDKFYQPDADDISRRTTWYYCPQALSEYKIPFLDIAARTGVLADMAPPADFDGAFGAPLFQRGVIPSTIDWSEQSAFRHYLTSLHQQVGDARKETFDATVDHHKRQLDAADKLVKKLRAAGVLGGDREFTIDVSSANRAALAELDRARGAQLRRKW